MPDPSKRKIPLNAVEIRRGPLGRWLPVPAGSPRDPADLGAEAFALSGIFDPILESHRDFKNARYEAKKADPKYRREIANIMLDRFNKRLERLARNPSYGGRVHYVKLLGTIGNADFDVGPDPSNWNDEIHGSGKGFKRLAAKLDAKISQISLSA